MYACKCIVYIQSCLFFMYNYIFILHTWVNNIYIYTCVCVDIHMCYIFFKIIPPFIEDRTYL